MTEDVTSPKTPTKWHISKGGKNLVLLGVISIFVALTTISVSLIIYHNSGDIYLDRSRPGYLPEEGEEAKVELPEEYNFDKSGKLTMEDIEEYLENLEADIHALDSYGQPFSPDALSDKVLGLPNEQTE